jgi:hypothetical protein
VFEIRLLFGASKTFSPGCLVLLAAVVRVLLCKSSLILSPPFCYSLGLGFLGGFLCFLSFLGLLCGSFGLLSLDFGVFSSIPRLEYIAIFGLFIVELPPGDGCCGWRRARRGRAVLFFVCSVK